MQQPRATEFVIFAPQVYDTGLTTTTTFLQHFKDVVTTKFSGRDHHLPPLHPHHQQTTLHAHHQPHQAVAQGFSTIFPTYLGMDRASGGNAAGGGLGHSATSHGGALNGLEAMSAESTGLCLQDLVSAGAAAGAGSAGSAESATTTSTALSSGSTGSSTVNSNASIGGGSDHMHNHHSMHDSSSSVSISPAISSLMPIGSLSHLHHAGSGQDLVSGYTQHHTHHSVVPSHTPKHEPLEKLRSKY